MSDANELINLMLHGHLGESELYLERLANERGCRKVIVDILEPALAEMGRRWEKEELSLAAGYLAGKVAENFLEYAATHGETISGSDGIAVIGNVEDDFHSLGRKLLGVFLKAAGWKVVDLGNDVPAEQFLDTAVSEKAHVIGVSAMMFTTAKNIGKVRALMNAQGLSGKIKLAVGGAVFKIRPELVAEVGGDGTAGNAVDAPALFESLKKGIDA